jgi:hypothetical protein
LDPDPLLLAAPHGNGNGDEVNSVNPRFHALNQALVQLVSRVATWLTRNQPSHMGPLSRAGARICEKTTGRARPRYFVAPSVAFSLEILAEEKAPIKAIMIFLPLPMLFFWIGTDVYSGASRQLWSTFTSTFFILSLANEVTLWRVFTWRDGQIEDHPLVTFLPLDLTNPDSIENVLSHIDYTMQYGEDEEPKEVGATRAAPVFPRLWYPAPREYRRGLHLFPS